MVIDQRLKQWVCVACGYNMIDERPDICPFCGASHDHFMSWDEAEKAYRVTSTRINGSVTQLVSVPKLGLEHAAYRIETEHAAVWIDCPSAFNRSLKPVRTIYFTHPHFMGASNLYRSLWNAKVCLHVLDCDQALIKPFPIDERFTEDFIIDGLASYHIGGHTPGYTLYIYQDVLFICDYAFPPGPTMRLNPFGSKHATLQGAKKIKAIIKHHPIKTVCGYNYSCDFKDWLPDFERATNHKS